MDKRSVKHKYKATLTIKWSTGMPQGKVVNGVFLSDSQRLAMGILAEAAEFQKRKLEQSKKTK